MLGWAIAQTLPLGRTITAAHSTVLRHVLYVFAFTVAGGAVAAGLYWALDTVLLRRSTPLRVVTGTAAAGIYLTTLTLAASLANPAGPWTRVTQPNFMLSTSVVSLVFGWFIARDPFALAETTERVYLTPAEFAALAPSDQARLHPDSTSPPEPVDPGSKR